MKKTIRSLILFVVTCICISSITFVFAATNIPDATSEFYVNDFANVFNQDEKAKLMTNAVSLNEEHDGIQVVVTTIKTLDGDTIENYANKMFNQYGIGKEDMGLLILLATEDRQIRVEVGKAMEGYINDSKAGRFIDKYAISYLKDNKFNEGLISLQEAFITEIKKCASSSENASISDNTVNIDIDWIAVLFVILFIALIGFGIWGIYIIICKLKKKKEEKEKYIKALNDKIKGLEDTIVLQNAVSVSLEQERQSLSKELNSVKQTLISIDSRYKLILKVYPDADKKVDEMIIAEKNAKDRAQAMKVDSLIASVINLEPDKDLLGRLESIKRKINSLNQDEVKYLQSDLDRFNSLYIKCYTLKKEYDRKIEAERKRKLTEQRRKKAANITTQILSVISMIGIAKASDLSNLMETKKLYEDLDKETKSYVDPSAISKLEDLIKRAKRDKEEEEMARRRRQAAYNSTNSYRSSTSSHSSFGGFGGRSGGGGASRRF